MPAMFKEVMSNLEYYNSPEKIDIRMNFARENSYARQLERIEKLIEADKLSTNQNKD
jgi:hypothetical protein